MCISVCGSDGDGEPTSPWEPRNDFAPHRPILGILGQNPGVLNPGPMPTGSLPLSLSPQFPTERPAHFYGADDFTTDTWNGPSQPGGSDHYYPTTPSSGSSATDAAGNLESKW
jgi:hypothetical protein